eukprot:6156302-Pleurochrysis_carterae.AAC.3
MRELLPDCATQSQRNVHNGQRLLKRHMMAEIKPRPRSGRARRDLAGLEREQALQERRGDGAQGSARRVGIVRSVDVSRSSRVGGRGL